MAVCIRMCELVFEGACRRKAEINHLGWGLYLDNVDILFGPNLNVTYTASWAKVSASLSARNAW